jgi:hypothetical protein
MKDEWVLSAGCWIKATCLYPAPSCQFDQKMIPPVDLLGGAGLRAAKAGTREEMERALVSALELVADAGWPGCFRRCGYQVAPNRNQL